jgi:hypothetical protein
MHSFLLAVLTCLYFQASVIAQTVFTVRGPEYAGDRRMEYDYALLELALLKTIDTHGPFEIRRTPPGFNFKRSILSAEKNAYPNFFVRAMASPKILKRMAHVLFPVDRGITGYRVAFVTRSTAERLKSVRSLEELHQFTIVQGIGWRDTDVLNANGLKVITASNFKSMIQMVSHQRSDMFLRGVNEILAEWQRNQRIKDVVVEPNLLIHYPFPRFLFTAKENTDAANRVFKGLIQAYQDGSMQRIWRHYFKESVDFAKMKDRILIQLENPFIGTLDTSYLKYNYSPTEK